MREPDLAYCHVQIDKCCKVPSVDLTRKDNDHHQDQSERKLIVLNDNSSCNLSLSLPHLTLATTNKSCKLPKDFNSVSGVSVLKRQKV